MRLLTPPLTVEERRALREAIAGGSRPRARVIGSSMAPTLEDGDEVELDDGPIVAGAVVAAEIGDRLVVHRVVHASAREVRLRGDAALKADAPLAREAILGRVARARRGGEPLALEAAPPAHARLRRRADRRRRALEVELAALAIEVPNRLRRALTAATEVAVLGTFDEPQLDRLTLRAYERSEYGAADFLATGLFPWEQEALDEYFPTGGSWLVTSAGGGREVQALLARADRLTATECSPPLYRSLARLAGPRVDTALRAPDEVPDGPFDAAIVGWGAFTHLASSARRRRFLARLSAQLAPGAPLLLSYHARNAEASRADRNVHRAASRLAGLLGRTAPELGGTVASGKYLRRFAPGEVPAEVESAGLIVRLESTIGAAHVVATAPGGAPR